MAPSDQHDTSATYPAVTDDGPFAPGQTSGSEQTALDIPFTSTQASASARTTAPRRRTPPPPETGTGAQIVDAARPLIDALAGLPLDERVTTLNALRGLLHEQSPFQGEPVDLVLWEKAESVEGNSYNPNAVAPRQMELLEHSITADGFTQPIVAWRPQHDGSTVNDTAAPIEVVDGFHRHLIGKHASAVSARLHGYLPITVINTDREALEDRQAATIRHNAARGVHTIEGLSEMVLQLRRERKPFAWFEKNLGMQPDEVTRLSQVSGLAEAFATAEFSEAWEADTDPFTTSSDT
ncbi:ParB N-terminal domain-containing protein [Streptomyces sp. NBC_01433]|uniref:ParB N-terminal domain-containing protein n=1 Tax=Streptomyces sp. NBC_01433 TaxID=2903864 RepID=UPI00224E7CA2|nr:ParB N-terminal domain-containing protein [Streptomyces sp. NBC_01433]MCX4681562.1 ParB N-terminal domain-containing protein [Streptomyces sp. NBC_01433]